MTTDVVHHPHHIVGAAHGDHRRATTRIFGSKPGSYGAGILQAIESGSWRDDNDLWAVLVGELWLDEISQEQAEAIIRKRNKELHR